jgi:TetR/AcrR family transcriptional repressor of nem operon
LAGGFLFRILDLEFIIDQSFTNCYAVLMARPRAFDETAVLEQARTLFAAQGYNGTSIDDLVKTTGLLRGSLYKAFGSKRNLFEMVLIDLSKKFDDSEESLDLLTVALKDLAPTDKRIREICLEIAGNQLDRFSALLGTNLLAKMKES